MYIKIELGIFFNFQLLFYLPSYVAVMKSRVRKFNKLLEIVIPNFPHEA